MSEELQRFDLTAEVWREYEFIDDRGGLRVYHIDNPLALYWKDGSTTHRIEDSNGVVHCPPAPGHDGCVLRWLNRKDKPAVQF